MADNKGKGSVTEFVVKLVLVFFISLLSFSVGTFVGKQVSDSDYRRASLEGELNISRSTASTDDTDTNELSEEEIASLTDEFIESEKKKLQPAPGTPGDHPAAADNEEPASVQAAAKGYRKLGETAAVTPSPKVSELIAEQKQNVQEYKKTIAAKSQAADLVAKEQAPSTGTPDARQPSSVLPSVASSAVGKYTVQIASYATETEAQGHASKLKDKGWNAFYIPAEINGRTWFRVSVGLFNSITSAKNFQTELSKEANITSSIVQKIVQ